MAVTEGFCLVTASVAAIWVKVARTGGSVGEDKVGTAWQASRVKIQNRLSAHEYFVGLNIYELSEYNILFIVLNPWEEWKKNLI